MFFRIAFYSSLYLLLSDSIQNILITFGPENALSVSFKGLRGAIYSTSKFVDGSVFPENTKTITIGMIS